MQAAADAGGGVAADGDVYQGEAYGPVVVMDAAAILGQVAADRHAVELGHPFVMDAAALMGVAVPVVGDHHIGEGHGAFVEDACPVIADVSRDDDPGGRELSIVVIHEDAAALATVAAALDREIGQGEIGLVTFDLEHTIDAFCINDGGGSASTCNGQFAGDLHVPGKGLVVGFGRQDDLVGAGKGVGFFDGRPKRGVARSVLGHTVPGVGVHGIDGGVDGKGGQHAGPILLQHGA